MDSLSISIPKVNSITQSINQFIDKLDTFRIKTHLRIVEAQLRRKHVNHLSEELKDSRETNLDRLHDYWTAGVFPKNLDFKGKFVPYFKDAVGTPCAMAYLMEESGMQKLVNEVAATNNYVYINDIKSGPVLEWIETSGLTQSEAARVQPTYGGGGFGITPIGGTPVNLGYFLVQNLPLIISIISFIILEIFSFKIAKWIGGEDAGRRLVGLMYFTVNSLVIAGLLFLLASFFISSGRFLSIY